MSTIKIKQVKSLRFERVGRDKKQASVYPVDNE